MSQFKYIASPVPLECTSYGSRKINIKTVEFLDDHTVLINGVQKIEDSFVTFKGKDLEWFKRALYLKEEGPGDGVSIGSGYGYPDSISHHFSNHYSYTLQMLTYDGDQVNLRNKDSMKYDKGVLCELLKKFKGEVEYFEFYSCWADEETFTRNESKDLIMTFEELINADYMTLHDKQYVRIVM